VSAMSPESSLWASRLAGELEEEWWTPLVLTAGSGRLAVSTEGTTAGSELLLAFARSNLSPIRSLMAF
jgi:hypothetical protein